MLLSKHWSGVSGIQEGSAHINGSLQIRLARKKLTASFPEIAASKIPVAGKNGGASWGKIRGWYEDWWETLLYQIEWEEDIYDYDAMDRKYHIFPHLPSCQVRVSRFYQSCIPPSASTCTSASSCANSSSQWALLDLNRSRSQWALPDLSQTLECQNRCQVECQKGCQRECQKECENLCQKKCQNRCQIECQNRCQKECQNICQKVYQSRCQT